MLALRQATAGNRVTDHNEHNFDGEQKRSRGSSGHGSEMWTDVLLSVGSKTYRDSENNIIK